MRRSLWIKLPTIGLALGAALGIGGALGVAVGAGILLLGTAILLAVVMHPNASLWARTRWRAAGPTDAVALTFDDGPDPAATARIAEILADRGVPAAFFVVGERARAHPDVVRRLHEAGHLVCNHTDHHAMTFHFRLWEEARRELRACNETIASLIGERPTLFRSPQGAKNPALGDVLAELDMTAVGWQVRGLDSTRGDADAIVRRVVDGARPGGVILLHDGGGFGGLEDRAGTVEALPRIIDRLRARGLRFVRLDELLEVRPYRAADA